MEIPEVIEYIEMPESLKDKYQYFTKAHMRNLRDAGYSLQFTPLEDAVHDYVVNYLQAEDPYL
jgi:ADP-L-glycero-D-manno-heptose 6-epimerase